MIPWLPILRGIRAQAGGENIKLSRILRQDGLIEISQSRPERFIPHGPRGTSLIHILWTFASLLVAAERTRVIIGRPHLPLALDFEWRLGETALLVPDVDTDDLASAKPTEQLCRVTDHEMPAKAQLPRLWERVQEEVLGSFGLTRDYGYQFDFEAALAAS